MCKQIDMVALLLVIVGGLNWLTAGVFQLDLVAYVLGAASMLAKVVYALVGFSALYLVFRLKKFMS